MQAVGASSAKSAWSVLRSPSLASGPSPTVSSPYSNPRARPPAVRTSARGSDDGGAWDEVVVFASPLQPATTRTTATSYPRMGRVSVRRPFTAAFGMRVRNAVW
jgi:hypothetical protein